MCDQYINFYLFIFSYRLNFIFKYYIYNLLLKGFIISKKKKKGGHQWKNYYIYE